MDLFANANKDELINSEKQQKFYDKCKEWAIQNEKEVLNQHKIEQSFLKRCNMSGTCTDNPQKKVFYKFQVSLLLME